MNEIIKNQCANLVKDATKSFQIKLEQWPCTMAVLGICATWAFVSWINSPVYGVDNKVV